MICYLSEIQIELNILYYLLHLTTVFIYPIPSNNCVEVKLSLDENDDVLGWEETCRISKWFKGIWRRR